METYINENGLECCDFCTEVIGDGCDCECDCGSGERADECSSCS